MTSFETPILFEDDYLVVVNKPAGLLVHKSAIDKHETEFLLQQLRDRLGCHLFPVHRLDKPTSGVIAFAKDPETASGLQAVLAHHSSKKCYLLLCRGFVAEEGVIDHPLKPIADFKRARKKIQDKPAQDAVTHFQCLAQAEIDVAIDKYPKSRFSLVAAQLETGRKHQIRRHFKHLSHPIIGCPKYGKSRYNQYFAEQVSAAGLMLHAWQLEFSHPISQGRVQLVAPVPQRLQTALTHLKITLPT